MDTQLQIKANSAQCLLDVFANTLALSVLSLQLIPFLQEVEKCVLATISIKFLKSDVI